MTLIKKVTDRGHRMTFQMFRLGGHLGVGCASTWELAMMMEEKLPR